LSCKPLKTLGQIGPRAIGERVKYLSRKVEVKACGSLQPLTLSFPILRFMEVRPVILHVPLECPATPRLLSAAPGGPLLLSAAPGGPLLLHIYPPPGICKFIYIFGKGEDT
jgi:hypothetical protein